MSKVTPRFLQSVFSDDVRHEVSGKITHVGICKNTLDIKVTEGKLPIVLPKLCVSLTAHTPYKQPFKKATFRVFQDNKLIREMPIPENLIRDVDAFPSDSSPQIYRGFQVELTMQNFSVSKSCVLNVELETEDEVINGPGLNINVEQPLSEIL